VNRTHQTLKNLAYDIIQEERLPMPKDIRFRVSLNGTISREGTCFKDRRVGGFRILIHTVKARFVPVDKDYKGKTYFRKNEPDVKLRRVMGTDKSVQELASTLAHEIAHLKFWNHSTEHTSYTNHLYGLFKERLHQRGIEIGN